MYIYVTVEIELKEGTLSMEDVETASDSDFDEFSENIETILKKEMTSDVIDVTVIEVSICEDREEGEEDTDDDSVLPLPS